MPLKKWKHVQLLDIPVERLNPLLERQFVHGEQAMLARLFLRKGCIVPEHSHPNEQITYVIEGALRFTLTGVETVMVSGGEMLVIPAHMKHSAEALEDTIDMDVFAPPREDWIEGTDMYLRKQERP
jgi:quercetin dioxygenase-like cupin family protein